MKGIRYIALHGASAGLSFILYRLFVFIIVFACHVTGLAQESSIPPSLRVPDGNKLSVHIYASGVQIYRSTRDQADTTKFKWVFVGPEATLYTNDSYKNVIGKHYAGPVWEGSDGSKVTGAKMQQTDAPDPDAIPWLLLSSTSNSGSGIFRRITFIQRLNTKGGKAPAMPASQANAGTEIRVPYTAEYFFYQP
jgi:uncharacterized protein DUF3455